MFAESMNATRILLVRHGETAWNAAARIQGHTDIDLNAAGREQARRLAAALDPSDAIDAVYSSDLARALQTARPVANAGEIALTSLADLRERHFGSFEGRRFVDIESTHPDDARRWRQRDPDWVPHDAGESLRVFRSRVVRAVSDLAARHRRGHLAIFTHGGVLDVIYRHATGLGLQDARSWTLHNTAINRLIWSPDGGVRLVGWGDVSHLDHDATLDERLR